MATSALTRPVNAPDAVSGMPAPRMLDQLPAAVYATDREGRLTYFNPSAVRFSGRMPELGTDRWCVSWKLYHADGSPMPHDECPMAIMLREGRPVHGVEAIAERPDGTRVPFMPYPSLLRDESGAVVGALNMLVDLTERNGTRHALDASEDRYRRLLGMLPAAVYTCEAPSGEITFFNEQAVALWGRRPRLRDSDERFCGSYRLWLPDGTALAHKDTPMALALREGVEARNREIIVERPDGTRVWVLVNIDPIRDASGEVVAAVNVFVDTTRLKDTERELARRTHQLAAFLDTAAIGLHRVGPDGRILWANDAEIEILGYSREEYVGRHIAEFHADAAAIDDILGRLRRGEKLRDYEARMRCKDGSVKTVHIDSSVLWEEGRFAHTQCFTRDITDRKRSEDAMAGLAAIVDSSEDAIIGATLDGVVTSWNRAAERIYGYAAAEALGRNISFVVPEDRAAEEADVLARLRSGERVGSFETERQTKDGRRVPIALTASPIRDGAGRIIGISKIARDITERKLAESALRDADRRKDEFLASLAHELRNPLAPIRTGLQILRLSGEDRGGAGAAIEVMDRQLRQLVRLIDDLLDISRISTGKIVLKRELLVLQDVLRDAVESVQPLAAERRQEVILTVPGEPLRVHGDAVRLTQVFSNLLNNALKFSGPGRSVTLVARRAGEAVEASVEDRGIGIPEALLSRVFEPFVQLDGGRPGENGGLGIGLTLVKRFVDLHGGRVTAESDGPGSGSRFVVTLDLAAGAAERTASLPSPMVARAATSRRILVVDDNHDAASSMAELLKLLGHEVRVANDGPQALRELPGFDPDVVVLDIGMPRMSGYEVCAGIKRSTGRPPRVVALTGWGQDADRRRSAEAGFDAHLVKPVDLNALVAAIEGGR